MQSKHCSDHIAIHMVHCLSVYAICCDMVMNYIILGHGKKVHLNFLGKNDELRSRSLCHAWIDKDCDWTLVLSC